MVREICNTTNAQDGHPELKVSKNTFMRTIKVSADCKSVSILHRKTRSKDRESAWAKAQIVFATHLTNQVKLGQDIDNGVTSSCDTIDQPG
jgi:ERCC4-related helicase